MLTNLGNFGSQFIGLDANLTPPTSDTDGGSEYLAASLTGMTGGLGSSFTSRQMLSGMFEPGDFITKYDRDKGVRTAFSDARWQKHSKYLYDPTRRLQIARDGDVAANLRGATRGFTGAAVNILPWTASVVGYLELLTGFGPPNEGSDLKSGAELWAALEEQLESAVPSEDWEGDASDAYAAQVTALRVIAKDLADLDGRLADIVADQAEWVTHIRLGFGILLNLLTTAIAIEVLLRIALAYVPSGALWASGWAIFASTLAISAALGMLGTLIGMSVENGNKADDVATEIERLGAAARHLVNDSTAQSVVATAPESRASEFQTLSNGPSPTLAAPRGQKPTSRKAAARESDGAEADTPEIPENLQGGSQSAGMPTLSTLMQMSNQAGNDSAQSPGRADALNPLVGRGRRPDPVADQEPAAAVKAMGAGAGSGAADRAPVEVAGEAQRIARSETGQ
ncbi:hypothetical protein A5730_08525 [Mycobacterium sp. ACS4054]|nr:hypothetical protein A5730_08525 [Mycobacterium sp. ACS4054]